MLARAFSLALLVLAACISSGGLALTTPESLAEDMAWLAMMKSQRFGELRKSRWHNPKESLEMEDSKNMAMESLDADPAPSWDEFDKDPHQSTTTATEERTSKGEFQGAVTTADRYHSVAIRRRSAMTGQVDPSAISDDPSAISDGPSAVHPFMNTMFPQGVHPFMNMMFSNQHDVYNLQPRKSLENVPHTPTPKQAISPPIGGVKPAKDNLTVYYTDYTELGIYEATCVRSSMLLLALSSYGISYEWSELSFSLLVRCVSIALLGAAAMCLSLVKQYAEEANRAEAMQFVSELVRQESNMDGNDRASTKKQRARAAVGSSARPRKERNTAQKAAAAVVQKEVAAVGKAKRVAEKVAPMKAKRAAAGKALATKQQVQERAVSRPAQSALQAAQVATKEHAVRQCRTMNMSGSNTDLELKQLLSPVIA